MAAAQTVLGLAVILVIFVDVFLTILSTSRDGPFTRGWSQPVWRLALSVHRRRPIHRALALTGPAIVILTILGWYSGMVLGTWLVLAAHPGAVVSSSTGSHADPTGLWYFVTTTLSSLGYGDLIPSGLPWTLFSTSTTVLTTMVLTISLSYVISVISAAIKRRSMASSIRALGSSPPEVVRHAQLGEPGHSMHTHLTSVASAVSEAAEQQLAYPVLRYFHSARLEVAAAPAVLLLADAILLLEHLPEDHRISPGLSAILRSAVETYAGVKTTGGAEESSHPGTADSLREQAHRLGIDTSAGSDFDTALGDHLVRRGRLVAACVNDGWAGAS